MSQNSFGKHLVLSTFGESHGPAIGGTLDGFPAGIDLDINLVQEALDRRKPGQSKLTTQRKEADQVEILSGIFEGKSLGTPIGFLIRNNDAKSKDYSHLKDNFRPSHADYTYAMKYGHRDHRGGGRASARETACRVVGGAIAAQLLDYNKIYVQAYVKQIGDVVTPIEPDLMDLSVREESLVRCPDPVSSDRMIAAIEQAKKDGDSLGGVIACVVQGVPVGLGAPVFDRLEADLAKACMSINATKGFSIGSGFEAASMKGSEHNDAFVKTHKGIQTKTNFSGGVQGGISNGMDIYFEVAFKPVATIMQKQELMNTSGESQEKEGVGRHDPCVVPRAVPIVEAMCNLVIADHYLRNLSAKA